MKPEPTAEDLLSPLGSGRPASRASTLRSKVPRSAGICLGCICGASSATAMVALLWFANHWGAMHDQKNGTDTRFCCPNEASRLFAVIDNKEPPCTDFFAYICTNAITQGFVQRDVAYDMVLDVASNIIKGTQTYGSQAAVALHALYTSCVHEVWHQDRRARDVVATVLEIANASTRISGTELLRFALAVEKRYQLRFIFSVISPARKSTWVMLKRRTLRITDYVAYCDDACYAAALSILNDHLGTNYTRNAISAWERKFPRGDRKSEPLSLVQIRDAFGSVEVLQFTAIFAESLINIDGVKSFRTISKAALIADIGLLRNYQPFSLSYLLLLVALEAMQYIQQESTLNSTTLRAKVVCNKHLDRCSKLWRMTHVAALASTAKDRQLHQIFKETRRRLMEYAPFLRLMAVGNDTEHFRAVIGNVSLMLPGDLVFQEPVVPNMSTEGFTRNLFLALNFEFEAKKENVRRRVPGFQDYVGKSAMARIFLLDKTTLYVSSLAYGWLSSGTSDPLLADAAVIASRMAALLWGTVLTRGWSPAMHAALKSLR